MKRYNRNGEMDSDIFVGIDIHTRMWHVTVTTADIELFTGSIPGNWESLEKLLGRYRGCRVSAVYEAGYFGFWLYDRLLGWGANCLVTPPSLVPMDYGNRVKTDKRDSRKLARLLAKGMLRRVWVPSLAERYHRQVSRRRHQLLGDRVRVQNRIKAELRLHGIELPSVRWNWSKTFVEDLSRLQFNDRWMQESFARLLEEYHYLCGEVKRQTNLLKGLSRSDLYRERVEILCTIPGMGVITAMEILLELGEMSRFRRTSQLAAYVGLTPSQYSSGDKIRLGRITRVGKSTLRGAMVEAAWRLTHRDERMREKYDQIKLRAGSKRAIVAIARRLLLSVRRMLLDGEGYQISQVA